MAIIHGSFYSETLYKLTNYTAILPEQPYDEVDVMYLLHGRSGNCQSWVNQTGISRYVADMPLVIFCPEVDLSYYCNMACGGKYWDFLTKEFPQKMAQFHPYIFSKTYVVGNSMGGYGALKWMLAEPKTIDFIGLLSPLVDVRRLLTLFPETKTEFQAVFQSEEIYDHSEHNLLTRLASEKLGKLPKIMHICGEQDFLYQDNLLLEKALMSVSNDYWSSFDQGSHDWYEWDRGIQQILNFLKKSEG